MGHSLTRRNLLITLTTANTVAISGCGGTDPTDGEAPSEDEDNEQEAREPEDVLFVASDEEYTVGESEQYDGVEIAPTGVVLFESNSSLELNDLMNA